MFKVLSILTLASLILISPAHLGAQNPKNNASKTNTPQTNTPKSNSKTSSKLTSTQASRAEVKSKVDSLLALGLDKEEIARQLIKKNSPGDKKLLASGLRRTTRQNAADGNSSPNQPAPPPPSTMTADEVQDAAEILRCFSPHTVTGNIDAELLSMIVEEFEIPSLDYLFQVLDAGDYLTRVGPVFQHVKLVSRWLQGAAAGASAGPSTGTGFRIPNWSGQFDVVLSLLLNKSVDPGTALHFFMGSNIGAIGVPSEFNVFLAPTRPERLEQLLPRLESTYGISEQMLMRLTIEISSDRSQSVNRLRMGIRTLSALLSSSFQRSAEYWAQVFKLENAMDPDGRPYPLVTSAEATSYLLEMRFTNQEVLNAIRTVYQN